MGNKENEVQEEIEVLEVFDDDKSDSGVNEKKDNLNSANISGNYSISNNGLEVNDTFTSSDHLVDSNKTLENVSSITSGDPTIDEIKLNRDSSTLDTTFNRNGNFKYIMTFILFIVLLLIVFFLPNISKFFSELRNNNTSNSHEKITTGTLKCTLENSDKKFDYSYLSEFEFENSRLLTLNYVVTTVGDAGVDASELESMNEKCHALKNSVTNVSGVSITCSLNKGTFIESQVLTYASIDVAMITSAYSEAGGIYPNFRKGDSIDSIESGMKSSGYSCKREK